MKSTKWKKYRLSKQKYPTRFVGGGGNVKGVLIIGWKNALKDLEKELGRALPRELDKNGSPKDRPKMKSTRGEWVFMEPLTDKEKPQGETTFPTTTKGE